MVIKRFDFEVPGWGEAAFGLDEVGYGMRPAALRPVGFRPRPFRPDVGGGGGVLSQDVGAGFSDRPVGGGFGVRVVLGSGEDGGVVTYDRGSAIGVTHVRVMLERGSVSGGGVVVMRGLDGVGVETFRCTYDGVGVAVVLGTSEVLSAVFDGSIGWQCVEVGIDAVGGEAAVWVNGVEADRVAGVFDSLGTRRVSVGAALKDAGAVGEFYLDEWAVGDRYIGVVVAEPAGEYGCDPARWVVVYNTAVVDSVAWVERYRAARGVPYGNLIGLALGTGEVIGASGYLALRDSINDYLIENGLAGQVVGVLLGYGVPGYVDLAGVGVLDSIAGLLYDIGTTPKLNPLAVDGVPERPGVGNLQGLKLTARIDGASVADADAMVDRATTLIGSGLGDGTTSTIWLDPYTVSGPGTDPHIDSMIDWLGSTDRMRTRLPIEVTVDAGGGTDPQFLQISGDGFFWGWAQGSAPAGFFAGGAEVGRRVFCIQLDPASSTGDTLRSGTQSNWVEAALDWGYAAAAGSSRAYSTGAVPFVRAFFEGLRRGWSLGEAWFVANPVLGEGLFLVGDPLMTVGFPRAGWDVYGPVARMEALEVDEPAALLRDAERSVDLGVGQVPVDSKEGVYLIRHVDGLGRSEGGARVARVKNIGGVGVGVALAPVWPSGDGWAATVEDGRVRLCAVWERSMGSAGVSKVELLGEIDGGGAVVLETIEAGIGDRLIEVVRDLPAVSARYAWRVYGVAGGSADTGWSGRVLRRVGPALELKLLGDG